MYNFGQLEEIGVVFVFHFLSPCSSPHPTHSEEERIMSSILLDTLSQLIDTMTLTEVKALVSSTGSHLYWRSIENNRAAMISAAKSELPTLSDSALRRALRVSCELLNISYKQ